MTLKDLIKKVQAAMNAGGSKLDVDGDFGNLSSTEADKYEFTIVAKPHEVVTPTPPPTDDKVFFRAPWVFTNLDLLGRTETDPQLNARYVPEWAHLGLPGYKTLAGNAHAWCSVRENADKRKAGIKGTNSAAAASWSSWGKKCPFWFGATLDIRHASGGRHVGDFLYWIDEDKRIAACLGGNQGDKFSVAQINLSGNSNGHDELASGPRWSNECPDGRPVSMKEVLEAYPFLKVGGAMNSTR